MWRYRELFFVLAWRDVSVRYKQTVIGISWAILRPLLTMIVFTIIFGRLAALPTEGGAPYPVLVFAGLLPWTLFSTALTEASNSIVSNATLVTKVYFPRVVVPAATIVAALVDFAISLAILFGLLVWYQFMPGWQILLLPIFILMTVLAALGPGLYFAAMTVKYRDFRYVVPFAIQMGLYISPVGFSSSIVPEGWRLLYGLNPLVGIIDGFRWCIIGDASACDWRSVAISAAVIAFMLGAGFAKFRRSESEIVDTI